MENTAQQALGALFFKITQGLIFHRLAPQAKHKTADRIQITSQLCRKPSAWHEQLLAVRYRPINPL